VTRGNQEKTELLQTLRRQLESPQPAATVEQDDVSSGCPEFDQILPAGCFQRGQLVEWLEDSPGSGASTLALLIARQAAQRGGVITIMDREKHFFPPAAAALGINLNNLLLIQAASYQDEFWALDQALRCPAVAAVWASVKHLEPRHFRRLQLAVEQSGSLGLLTRPLQVRGQPSWSQIQLLVQPRPGNGLRRWRIEVIRARGDRAGRAVELEMDDTTGILRESSHEHQTNPLHLDSQLASPASDCRAS
jgi:protein ImuA